MKLLVLIENLQKHLPLLYRGVSTRSQLPVLLNILLVAKNGKFFIKSTDLEIGIEAENCRQYVDDSIEYLQNPEHLPTSFLMLTTDSGWQAVIRIQSSPAPWCKFPL